MAKESYEYKRQTVNIEEGLAHRAKLLAAYMNTTLSALYTEGIEMVLEKHAEEMNLGGKK